jgi:hypothetical protein
VTKDAGGDAVIRGALAQIAVDEDQSQLQAFIDAIPADRLAPIMIEVMRLAAQVRKALAALEFRYGQAIRDEVLEKMWRNQEGEIWLWGAQLRWEVPDPDGFADRLKELAASKPLWRDRIRSAYKPTWKFDHGQLNAIMSLDREIGDAIREFRRRSPKGPHHLKKFESSRT